MVGSINVCRDPQILPFTIAELHNSVDRVVRVLASEKNAYSVRNKSSANQIIVFELVDEQNTTKSTKIILMIVI